MDTPTPSIPAAITLRRAADRCYRLAEKQEARGNKGINSDFWYTRAARNLDRAITYLDQAVAIEVRGY